jgi:hypothetical protein
MPTKATKLSIILLDGFKEKNIQKNAALQHISLQINNNLDDFSLVLDFDSVDKRYPNPINTKQKSIKNLTVNKIPTMIIPIDKKIE